MIGQLIAVVSADWLLQERGQECNSSGNSGSGGSVSIGPLVNNNIPHPPPHTCDYLGRLLTDLGYVCESWCCGK